MTAVSLEILSDQIHCWFGGRLAATSRELVTLASHIAGHSH